MRGTERKHHNHNRLEATDPIELEEVYYSEYMTQQREEAANEKATCVSSEIAQQAARE